MKKGLSLILLIIAAQSYAAITWNCTSSDIKQSYLPKECTGIGSNSSSNPASTTPTTTKIVDMSGCVDSEYNAVRNCAVNMANSFATNGRVLNTVSATCDMATNKCYPLIELQNTDGSISKISINVNNNYAAFSNYSEVLANAAICDNLVSPMSNCPSGTYAKTLDANGNPYKLVLVP